MFEDPLFAAQVFILSLLLVAIASEITFRRLRVPYSIGLIVVGFVLGLLLFGNVGMGWLGAVQRETVFFFFLPILVFESALNLDARLLARNLLSVLTLAVPGLLIATAIVGVAIAWLTPLPLSQAILFGALISATDPVAVIALFKELGAPKRLTILAEGESLFNDATAIVLFELVLLQIEHGGSSGAEALEFATLLGGFQRFAVVFFGGILVGLALGLAIVRLIPLEYGNPMVQVATSVVMAFVAFLVAEDVLHVSGVMATVGAGLVVGWYRDVSYSREARESIQQFWEFAAFLANSLIFLLVGLAQAGFVLELSDEGVLGNFGEVTDLLAYAAVAVVAVLLARAFVIWTFFPLLLNRLPGMEPVDWRYQLTMFWGGLKGAVGVALALSLDPALVDRRTIVGLTLAVVFFTALASGTTIGRLIHGLRLDIPSLTDRVLKAQTQLTIAQSALARLGKATQVGHFSHRLRQSLQQRYEQEIEQRQQTLQQLRDDPCYRTEGIDRQLLWLQALNLEQAAYTRLYERGSIADAVMKELRLTLDLKRDAVRCQQIPPPNEIVVPPDQKAAEAIANLLERIAPHSHLAKERRLAVLTVRYECEAAVSEVASTVAGEVHLDGNAIAACDRDIIECRNLYRQMSIDAMKRLDRLAHQYPEYAILLQKRAARALALDSELMALAELTAEGDVPPMVAREIRHHIETQQYELVHQPVVSLPREPQELLRRLPAFRELPKETFQAVSDKLELRTVLAGETILTRGDVNNSIFLIGRGSVAVFGIEAASEMDREASLHAGDCFGEAVLLGDRISGKTVRAVTDCALYEFNCRDLAELPEVYEGLKEMLFGRRASA
ncbi:cation:proton antiporter [Synechococcus sp. PCC 7336]|uniref:cation:proton antiporter n=1 Tax=Synechococcus sp. PCC 7336 TaxID=195250 RepID=UPI00034D5600|nr:cation:proton antiporter [Synechococcus sp. PCC 7336]